MTDASLFFNQQNLTSGQFLQDYWQQKPLLLRQAFPGFRPELDADDIAGLACEEMAESRVVSGTFPEHDWSLRYGPFLEQDLTSLPPRKWTLLVQDVEKHYPPLRSLMAAFSFLPRWRIDDLMVSVAAPGGSVGPHVDQYDVFLLQASGRRRWEIAIDFDPALLPGCDLNVLLDFKAQQTWELEPGDMLYLPPGVAHHGVAVDVDMGALGAETQAPLCMTWSIGMRAPSAADLLQALGEWLAEAPDEGGRYRDPGLSPTNRPGEIDGAALQRFRNLLHPAIEDADRFSAFIGAFISGYRLAHEPAAPPRSIDQTELARLFQRGATLHHNPWTRLAWQETPRGALLFASGLAFPCSVDEAMILCDPEQLGSLPASPSSVDAYLLCELINRGHLLIEPL